MRAVSGPWIGGPPTAKPSELFRRHVLVTPYPEEDLTTAYAVVGSDSLVIGSDWPHPEGFAESVDFAARVERLPEADRRRILHDNGARLVRG